MSFNCDLLFSYVDKREYVGQLFNYRNVATMQVQRVFDATTSYPPDNPSGVPALITGAYTGIIVNGVSFGTGRIISYSNPVSADITENGRHLWKQIVNMEVTSSGDLSNIDGSASMQGMASAFSTQLQSLDETFTFEMQAEGDYQYTHGASVKCLDDFSGFQSGFIIAKKIASGLITSAPPFGYVDNLHSGLLTTIGKRHYTETIDIYNGSVSFEEKFVIQNRDFAKHSIAFENGFVNISESITIRHSGVNAAIDVFGGDPSGLITRYNNVFGGSYTRCNSLWTTYQIILGVDSYSPALNTMPAQLNKAFDERTQELTYTAVYTNNPQMTANGYAIEREQVFSANNLNITEATEQGNITAYAPKDDSLHAFLATAVTNEIGLSSGRLITLWSPVASFNKFSETRNLSSRGKRASYNVGFTNDPSFINNGTYLTKNITIQDERAIVVHNPYLIIGRPNPLVHTPGQTQFGSTSCTISAFLPRPVGYRPSNPLRPVTLNQVFIDAVNIILQNISAKVPLDVYVSKVSYTYNSDMSIELSVAAQYIYARGSNI